MDIGVNIKPISPPEPDLTPEEIVQRAKDLVPYLRERALEHDENRMISDEVHQKLLENGFYRILQPKIFGGYEFSFRTYVDAFLEISRGDSAVGWSIGFVAGHTLWAALLPLEGQLELFGEDGDFRAPVVTNPFGEARKTEGGYIVNGNWNYSSGIEQSNWVGGYVKVVNDKGEQIEDDLRVCFVRKSECEIVDNWHVLGLRGTASKQTVVKDVFVPEKRTIIYSGLVNKAPGHDIHDNPFYRTPISPVLGTKLVTVAVGVAQAAIDFFVEYAETKRAPFPPFPVLKEESRAHVALGKAMASHQAAKELLYALVDRVTERGEQIARGEEFDRKLMIFDISLCQQIVSLCVDTVNTIYEVSGTRGAYKGNLLEKLFRDINMIRTHYYCDYSRTNENIGAVGFGLTPKSYM